MNAVRERNEFRWPVRVYFEDTDAAGIVYHANYLKFMERARTEWLRRLGYDQSEFAADEQFGFVVRKMTIDFIKAAMLDDELEVVSVLEHCNRASMLFRQTVVAVRDQIELCAADVKVACIDLARRRAIRIPKPLYAELLNAY